MTKAYSTDIQFRTRSEAATASADESGRRFRVHVPIASITAVAPTGHSIRSATAAPTWSEETTDAQHRREYSVAINKGIGRLREFSRYKADWDSNGASPPSEGAIDAALRYLTLLQFWHPNPFTTITRDGDALLEFDEGDAFGSVLFRTDGNRLLVEVYSRPSRGAESRYDEGLASDTNINRFLRDELKLPTLYNDTL